MIFLLKKEAWDNLTINEIISSYSRYNWNYVADGDNKIIRVEDEIEEQED